MKFDWVVVGAGFTGATFAERMASVGKRVMLVESRNHVGGNAYDYFNKNGILVHRYGPHIFHTNSAKVHSYLSKFTSWRPYEHRVLGLIEGKLVPIPFNLSSLSILFSTQDAAQIQQGLISAYGAGRRIPILKLLESDRFEIRNFASYVFDNVFMNYTIKQWGLRPDQLSSSVLARVPIDTGRDDRYFQDKIQAMPLHGYTAMFQQMTKHPNIELVLSTQWSDLMMKVQAERILYTGAIDEFLDYRLGALPYRSLEFREQTLEKTQHQRVGTINFPNDYDYTRITESKVLTGQVSSNTTLVVEYPKSHEPGVNIAYYPIPRLENEKLYGKYLELASSLFPSVIFAGRLADYQYYNMDQACARALKLASVSGGPTFSEFES